MSQDAFIIDGVRTPIGNLRWRAERGARRRPGGARDRAAACASSGARSVARSTDVILGCANQAGEDNRNVARMALLLAGLPHTVPGETVNRLCASGLERRGAVPRAPFEAAKVISSSPAAWKA